MSNPSRARIELRSDNSVGVAPEILAAVVAADGGGAMAYGDDPWTERLHRRVAEVFERDDVAVFPVVSGTAAEVQTVQDTVGIFDVDWLRGMSLGLYPLDNVDPVTLEAELARVLSATAGQDDGSLPKNGIG